MNIKKQYQEIHSLLVDNKDKKVSTILKQLEELMQAKQATRNFKTDEAGNVTHIYCYFHKVWEDVNEIEYGKKASSATGLNSMCKLGVSLWTKQQKALKDLEAKLLDDVMSGKLKPEDIEAVKAKEIAKIKS